MHDYFNDFDELPHEGMHFSVPAVGKHQLGLGANFPVLTVFAEALPHGLIGDEI